jgi:hypothetical protein
MGTFEPCTLHLGEFGALQFHSLVVKLRCGEVQTLNCHSHRIEVHAQFLIGDARRWHGLGWLDISLLEIRLILSVIVRGCLEVVVCVVILRGKVI